MTPIAGSRNGRGCKTMTAIYFFFFCILIAGIILWGYLNDDYEKFNDENDDNNVT